jgi:enoyl-CoA hydratase
MVFENILIEKSSEIVTITINRPSKLNALNADTINELHQAFRHLASQTDCKVIILTGAGDKAFVAGADITAMANYNQHQGAALAQEGQEKLFDFIENLNKPVIAAINGFALGGGLELAMACHIRIAAENAKMGLPEASLGLIPGYGGTQRLPQLVGKGKALEMMLTAEIITAQQALEYKLINSITTPETLLATCQTLALKICKNAPLAIHKIIQAVNTNQANGFATEIQLFGACFGTADFIEGTTAFIEKRKPIFKGK